MSDRETDTYEAAAPLLVSLREAAHLLGVSERTVRAMVARHELPVRRIGRRALVPRAALVSFAAAR